MSKSPDDLYLDGFNRGYTLAKLDPKLAEDVSSSFVVENNYFVQGFQAGRNEYIKELEKEMTYEKFSSEYNPPSRKDLDSDFEISR